MYLLLFGVYGLLGYEPIVLKGHLLDNPKFLGKVCHSAPTKNLAKTTGGVLLELDLLKLVLVLLVASVVG